MLHSPEGNVQHKDITNASLTIAGEPDFVYGCVFSDDRCYGDVMCITNCNGVGISVLMYVPHTGVWFSGVFIFKI